MQLTRNQRRARRRKWLVELEEAEAEWDRMWAEDPNYPPEYGVVGLMTRIDNLKLALGQISEDDYYMQYHGKTKEEHFAEQDKLFTNEEKRLEFCRDWEKIKAELEEEHQARMSWFSKKSTLGEVP